MNFLTRTPFAILGAFGLVSLADGGIELERHLADWVRMWQSVTYPVMEFLFGWAFDWIGWKFPEWLKDYLTVGTITLLSVVRAFYKEEPGSAAEDEAEKIVLGDVMLGTILFIFFWPVMMIFAIHSAYYAGKSVKKTEELVFESKEQVLIFFETFAYAALLILGSYALIFSGVSAPAAP